ncbi:dermonecrotic toxin domain-containing protein [Pseudomonas xantholysinigenes]|uniref:Dermonecrotic toxin N-terminal domain-containing protein n=1 Tax=Pseudomonas xantholysinigenes TaxID=2745490 RepID=A0A9E6PVH0_9PSED|nr:DUF6543 domain-containing protein [Pseudomonas xantholysinigenes]QXI38149.1 hypothetical protein HU772_022945 [Pseudomonas xantholysinigenes]
MSLLQSPTSTFQDLVARQFLVRPTLSQVLDKETSKALIEHCSQLKAINPALESLKNVYLILAGAPAAPLSDKLLESLVVGSPLTLVEGDCFLTTQAAGKVDTLSLSATEAAVMGRAFSAITERLLSTFQRAQVSFWLAKANGLEVSRLQWVAQMLKVITLNHIGHYFLEDHERESLYQLLDGTTTEVCAQGIQVSLSHEARRTDLMLPYLLLSVKSEASESLICCKPSGEIRRFENTKALGDELQNELLKFHEYSQFSWSPYTLAGDPFEFQALQLLNGILNSIEQLDVSTVETPQRLVAYLQALSNPSRHFSSELCPSLAQNADTSLSWLTQAPDQTLFEYCKLLLPLTAAQRRANDSGEVPDIESLEQYTLRRLREQMSADHLVIPPCNPDLVTITLDHLPSKAVSENYALGGPDTRHQTTLTSLAISRSSERNSEYIVGAHNKDQPLPVKVTTSDWTTLVTTVDIGGTYPVYVNERLTRSEGRAERISAFARTWRSSLLGCALRAFADKVLSEPVFKEITSFCSTDSAQGNTIEIAPLVIPRSLRDTAGDDVANMFILRLAQSGVYLLYRPWYASLLEFPSLPAMAKHFLEDKSLQESFIAWMDNDAALAYGGGAFPPYDYYLFLNQVVPFPRSADFARQWAVKLAFTPYPQAYEESLYESWGATLIRIAAKRAPSSDTLRHEWYVKAAWGAFDLLSAFSLFLGGPVATTLLAINLARVFYNDVPHLFDGSAEDKTVSAIDLLVNFGVILISAGLAGSVDSPAEPIIEQPDVSLELSARGVPGRSGELPEQKPWIPPERGQQVKPLYVAQWGNSQRLGNLSSEALQQLSRLRATVSVSELSEIPEGILKGLYTANDRTYVDLQGVMFEVDAQWGSQQIIGPNAEPGPWLERADGQWKLTIVARGGGGHLGRTVARPNIADEVSTVPIEEEGIEVESGNEVESEASSDRDSGTELDFVSSDDADAAPALPHVPEGLSNRQIKEINKRLASNERFAARLKEEKLHPSDLRDQFEARIRELESFSDLVKKHNHTTGNYIERLQKATALLRSEMISQLSDAYLNLKTPALAALKFLKECYGLRSRRFITRKATRRTNDYWDGYAFYLNPNGRRTHFEIHIHYKSADSASRNFEAIHLKLSNNANDRAVLRLADALEFIRLD